MTVKTKRILRPSGIDFIDDIPWGTHICQFYETAEDLTDILVPYFKAGLKNNEMCVWVTAEPLGVKEARKALSQAGCNLEYYEMKKQINILDYSDFYRQSEAFDCFNILQKLIETEVYSLDNNFDGLRINGNVSWLYKDEWKYFIEYESAVDAIIRRHKIIAICSYPQKYNHPAEIVDIVSNHRNIIIRKHEKMEYITNNGYGYITRLKNSGYNYTQIARIVGVSRQRISQIFNKEKADKNTRGQYLINSELLTSQGAAEFLNVHINTIRRWSDSGILPSYRVGQRNDRRFNLKDLEEFLSKIS